MQTENEQIEELQPEQTAVEETPTEEIEQAPEVQEAPEVEETLAEEEATEDVPPAEPPVDVDPLAETPLAEEQPVPKLAFLKRINYKSPKFWIAVIGGVLCLAALIVIIVALGKPREQKPESKDHSHIPHTSATAPTEPTEPTLPPPEENPIAIGDFAMMGGYLTCLSTESVLGIDVSEWQGTINWQQVKEAGIEYAMIRVGYRGWKTGELCEDPYAQANYAGATEAGIKIGAYFFSQAITPAEAVEEANYLMELIKHWNVEMPVVFDWEPYPDEEARTANMDARTLTDCSKAFCDAVKAAGYEPMVYFNISHSLESIYIRELTDYKFWLARYDTVLVYPYKIDMWQYTETGSVPGIYGNVDINLYFPWKEE